MRFFEEKERIDLFFSFAAEFSYYWWNSSIFDKATHILTANKPFLSSLIHLSGMVGRINISIILSSSVDCTLMQCEMDDLEAVEKV